MELLGATRNELLFFGFLLALVVAGTKIGDVGAALGRWWTRR